MQVVTACIAVYIHNFTAKIKTGANPGLHSLLKNLVGINSTGSNYAALIAHKTGNIQIPAFKGLNKGGRIYVLSFEYLGVTLCEPGNKLCR